MFRTQTTPPRLEQRFYNPRGAAMALLYCRDPVVLMDGPAGTGKTRCLLEKLFLIMQKYPGCRLLLLRKTRKSLTQSAMVTWEQKVLPPGWKNILPFHTTDQEYRHKNGSILAVAGLDDPGKIMSTEWDVIAVPEATELSEAEFEMLTTRNRNFGGGMEYQQIIMDCNPQHPTHWLNVRCDVPIDPRKPRGAKLITRLKSRHKDNPEYWDEKKQEWTAKGRQYLSNLKRLSGVRFFRLFKGLWRQSDGMVFDEYNPDVHWVKRRIVPDSWPRYWGIDFGFTNPFCWQEWAMDEDGRLWLVNEIYYSKLMIPDAITDILKVTSNLRIRPRAVVCDHDAQGRAQLEKGLNIKTIAAFKDDEQANINAIKLRLRSAEDGLPRIFFMQDSLYRFDRDLEERHLPTETIKEIDGYIWDERNSKKGVIAKERAVNENDHGMKAMEYVVGWIDKAHEERKKGAKQASAYASKR